MLDEGQPANLQAAFPEFPDYPFIIIVLADLPRFLWIDVETILDPKPPDRGTIVRNRDWEMFVEMAPAFSKYDRGVLMREIRDNLRALGNARLIRLISKRTNWIWPEDSPRFWEIRRDLLSLHRVNLPR